MAAAETGGAPGNWLASEIRRFQENSQGLFPSPKPGDEQIRFKTVYGIEYVPMSREKPATPPSLRRPGMKRETPFSLEQAKRFNTWKVKKDLVDVEAVQQRVAERRKTAALEASNGNATSFPAIGRSKTVGSHVPKTKDAEIRTPVLPPGPKYSGATPSHSMRSGGQSEVRMSAPAAVNRDSARRLQRIKRDLVNSAEDYMQRDPQADRRVIDKALRGSNRHYRENKNQLVTELPDTKKAAEKWLDQATEQEQELALRFFKSVSGMRLMGLGGKKEQTDRLNGLLHTLEIGEAKIPSHQMTYEDEQKIRARKQRNLQFVRLLSPQSRENKDQLQSWHHLPNYRPVNRADNIRSHFTQPQKPKPLHFTIHPDWGP